MKQAVIAVIFDESRSHLLITKRRDVPVWVLPGGGVDNNETPEEAIVREVWEETGFRVHILRQVGFYTPINSLTEPTTIYECKIIDGLLRMNNEISDVGFYPLSSIKKQLFIIHNEWVEDALLNLSTPLHKEIRSVTYLNLFCYFLCHPSLVIRYAFNRFSVHGRDHGHGRDRDRENDLN